MGHQQRQRFRSGSRWIPPASVRGFGHGPHSAPGSSRAARFRDGTRRRIPCCRRDQAEDYAPPLRTQARRSGPPRRHRRTASARNAGSRTTPPAPTRSRPTSNCGFTISTRSPSGARAADQRRQHQPERDERQVGDDEATGPPMASGVSSRTLVRSHAYPRVGTQRPGQLPVADVDRDDLGGAGAQQHVGEAAGGGAGVQAAPAGDRQPERRERASAPASLCRRARRSRSRVLAR